MFPSEFGKVHCIVSQLKKKCWKRFFKNLINPKII
uniref:Uncharacterized protein n=1 Tax=Anguilla anguilla TaxID=7936 RepID=A0A0E9UZZ8_ANGAN